MSALRVHIEGMGVIGSILAHRLAQLGYDFTWHDTEDPVNAWFASTSLVYPSGSLDDQRGLDAWNAWRMFAPWDALTEHVPYYFTTKAQPHGGRYQTAKAGPTDLPWKLGGVGAIAVNVQALVWLSRVAWKNCRLDAAPEGVRVIIAHGTGDNPRRREYLWGWSRPVWLNLPQGGQFPIGERAALYHRTGRMFSYAYPVAGTDYHWAGSSLVVCQEPRSYDAPKHFDTWVRRMADVGVTVEDADDFREGWRPRGDDTNDTEWVREIDGRLVIRPLWHSGVRWAPQLTDAVLEAL